MKNKILHELREHIPFTAAATLIAVIIMAFLLIKENLNEVVILAKRLKEIGVDYFTVKPYSHHPKSINIINNNFNYYDYLALEKRLEELTTNSFQIFFRSHSMKKLNQKRNYTRCWGLPFWAYIDAGANVWACIAHIGDQDFCYGNLSDNSFTEIWDSPKRNGLSEKIGNMDISGCRELCRLDEINSYLNELKNPNLHVNFI